MPKEACQPLGRPNSFKINPFGLGRDQPKKTLAIS